MELQFDNEVEEHSVTVRVGNIKRRVRLDPLAGTAGRLWSSALVLSRFLQVELGERHAADGRLSILELGAGCGLPSSVCATLGARVTATDKGSLALSLLRANLESWSRAAGDVAGSVDQPRVLELDWNDESTHSVSGPFDLVIGSDITFWDEAHAALAAVLRAVSTPLRTRILLAERPRLRALTDADFFQDVAPQWFSVERLEHRFDCESVGISGGARAASAIVELDEAANRVQLYELRLTDAPAGV